MKTIDIYTYPDGNADQLAQDDIVSRLQPNGRFVDTYVADLVPGDQYSVPENEIQLVTDEEIIDRLLKSDILFNLHEYSGQTYLTIFKKESLETLEQGDYNNNTELRGLFRELMTKLIHNEEL